MKKLTFIFIIFMLFSTPAHAALIKEPIKSDIELQPGQKEVVTIDSREDLEIGWETTQEPKCADHCYPGDGQIRGI